LKKSDYYHHHYHHHHHRCIILILLSRLLYLGLGLFNANMTDVVFAEEGDVGRAAIVVDEARLAVTLGSGSLRVFGTPALIALVEAAAVDALAPRVEKASLSGDTKWTSVGTALNVSHSKPSAEGARVWAEATVTKVDRRSVEFKVEAFEGAESAREKLIGSGTHSRFVVDSERFMQRL
jgi:fluoroacetyl-CoA thioesterase